MVLLMATAAYSQIIVVCPTCGQNRDGCGYDFNHPTFIKVDAATSTTRNFGRGESSGNVIVTTDDRKSWSAKSNVSWCTARRVDGSTLSLHVGKNTMTESRTAKVTVKTSDGNHSAIVIVTQAAGTPSSTFINVNGNSSAAISIVSSGGASTVTISTDASDWSYSGLPSWCSASRSGRKLTIRADKNNSRQTRFDSFTVSTSDGKHTAKVTVTQSPVQQQSSSSSNSSSDYLYVNSSNTSPQNISVGSSKVTHHFAVNTNSSYRVELLPGWTRVINQKNDGFDLIIEENRGSARKDWFRVAAGSIEVKVYIEQKGGEKSIETYLKVSGYTSSFNSTCKSADGCTGTYYVETNAFDYTVEGYPYWISVDEKTSTSFKLKFSKNYDSERTGTVTVKAGNKLVQFNVVQVGSSTSSSKNTGTSTNTSSRSTSPKTHNRGDNYWEWDVADYKKGFYIGYTNYQLNWQSNSAPDDTYTGDDIWGEEGRRIHGGQFGFSLQETPDWWFGIGYYTGLQIDLFYTFNNPKKWTGASNATSALYTSHKEYAVTLPVHIFLRLPLPIDNVNLWGHAGIDFSYYWGGRYHDNRGDYVDEQFDYDGEIHRKPFNISLSFAGGLQIDQFVAETVWSIGFLDHEMSSMFDTKGKATFNQLSFRISWLIFKRR